MRTYNIFLACFLCCFLVFGHAHAGWVPVATVNEKTPGHLCDVDDNGLDLFCGATNPEILIDGTISATNLSVGNTISTSSLFVNGQTYGADQVISGTTNITTNENSSISFTTAGTERMILTDSGQLALGEGTADPSAILDISTTTQGMLPPRLTSTQRDNISNPAEGLMVFNTEEGAYQFWGGSNWVNLGGGIPNGTIAAFATASCPSGWAEYTPARGRFLRGIDPTGTLDPDGIRTPGSTQEDMFESHSHRIRDNDGSNTPNEPSLDDGGSNWEYTYQGKVEATGGDETRPKNVAVTFCEYTGGAPVTATPSGSAGEVQFADGSGGLSSDANFVMSGGNLGIGDTTPDSKLDVEGGVSGRAFNSATTGQRFEWGTSVFNTTQMNSEQEDYFWNSIIFNQSFSGTPLVFCTVQTENGASDPRVCTVRSVTSSGFDLGFCEIDEYTDGDSQGNLFCDSHATETVGWIAVGPD